MAILLGLCSGVFAQSQADGINALKKENYQTAERIFTALKTNAAEDYYYLGQAYCFQNKWDSAALVFQQGIAAYPKAYCNYIGLGKTYLNQNRTADAKTQFDLAKTKTSAKNIELPLMLAEAMTNVEYPQADEALTILDNARAIDDKSPAIFMREGDVYARTNSLGKAYSSYINALNYQPMNAEAKTKIGIIWNKGTQYQLSIPALNDALKIDSTFAPAYRELAEATYSKDPSQIKVAKGLYERYLQLADHNDYTNYRYAQFLYLSKDYQHAAELLTDLMKRDPNPIMRRLAGYAYAELHQYPMAEMQLDDFFQHVQPEKIISLDYKYAGTVAKFMGKDHKMIYNYEQVLKLDTTQCDLLDTIAKSFDNNKVYDTAALYYQQKLNCYKRNGMETKLSDYKIIAIDWYLDSSYVKADSAFSSIIRLNDKFGALADLYLWRARSENALEKDTIVHGYALPMYLLTLEKGAADTVKYKKVIAEANVSIGEIYRKQGKYAECIPYYQKYAAGLDPESKTAKAIYDMIDQINKYLKQKAGGK